MEQQNSAQLTNSTSTEGTTLALIKKSTHHQPAASRQQVSSFLLFASLILFLNLCPPFQLDFDQPTPQADSQQVSSLASTSQHGLARSLETCLEFVQIIFSQPMRMNARATRYTLAEARVLGKMAKVWYIKKKIKKLSKKLKKHTIAVPVFTAIPIYEHSYYPQPHVTHVSHGAMHHQAAASSYSPSLAAASAATAASSTQQQQQQLATSASNQHYRMAPPGGHHHAYHSSGGNMYHPHAAASHQIINAYTPSQPLYVDDSGGLYGHYGNAYGRYDGGYHIW